MMVLTFAIPPLPNRSPCGASFSLQRWLQPLSFLSAFIRVHRRPKYSSPMPDLKSLSPEILHHLAKLLHVPMKGLLATIEHLDEGGTVPFIARYRKEATGNLDEVQIRTIEEKLLYFRELQDRKATILASIQEQGKLTDELKARIEASLEKSEIEDLYLPFKPKRRTKATIAREKGFDPLAQYLWAQQLTNMPLK